MFAFSVCPYHSLLLSFCYLFFLCLVFETRSHYLFRQGLESLQTSIGTEFTKSSCLCLPSVDIIGVLTRLALPCLYVLSFEWKKFKEM